MRTLALVIFVFNVTWGAAWSVLVLYSLDHLHMGEVGFGLLTSAAAIGGLIGTFFFGRIERTFSLATVMRTCLLLEVLTHLALALTTVGWVAMVVMVVFGALRLHLGDRVADRAAAGRSRPSCRDASAASTWWACSAGWSSARPSAACSPRRGA